MVRQSVKRWRDKLAMTTGDTNVMVSKVEPGRFPAVSLLSWIKRWVSEAEPAVY
jgi:hypothetical protein